MLRRQPRAANRPVGRMLKLGRPTIVRSDTLLGVFQCRLDFVRWRLRKHHYSARSAKDGIAASSSIRLIASLLEVPSGAKEIRCPNQRGTKSDRPSHTLVREGRISIGWWRKTKRVAKEDTFCVRCDLLPSEVFL